MIKSSTPQEIQCTISSFTTLRLQEMCEMLINVFTTKLPTDNNDDAAAATPFAKLFIEAKVKIVFLSFGNKGGNHHKPLHWLKR